MTLACKEGIVWPLQVRPLSNNLYLAQLCSALLH